MKINQFSLANGLNVFLVPQKEATSVAVELMIKTGSKHEKEGTEGLAHFLEHMAFKGTEKWPTALKLAKVLDSVGAVYNAYTDKEKTAYWIKIAPQYLDLSLEVISQMLNHALLKQEEINIERGVIVEELHMYEDMPMDKVWDFFEEQMLGNNPLGRAIIGKKKTIVNLKRQDFVDFKKSWYQTGRMSLAVAGAIGNVREAREKIKKFFGEIAPGKREETEFEICPKKKPIFWRNKKTEQTHLALGLPTVNILDKKKWTAEVLTAVLGQGMSSRLWLAIRERRGWAYYVYATHVEYLPAGYLAIKAGVKNEISRQAIEVIQEELKRLLRDLGRDEVERVKRMLNGWLMIVMENAANVASLLNKYWLFGNEVMTPEVLAKKTEQVKFSQVKEFAEQFINLDHLRGAVIGP